MNRPLWHFLRAPVSAGKRYSGWNRTSTMTEDSACTSGCSCASSSTTMSCKPSMMLRSMRTPNCTNKNKPNQTAFIPSASINY